MSKKILLHICCAVCAAYPVQKLREDGYVVTGYFYNPNIHSKSEYEHRLDNAKRVSKALNFELIEGNYDHEGWLSKIKGFESEREGGLRCNICFEMRLKETFNKTQELEIPCFTSTLTVSPHKNAKIINKIGENLCVKYFLSYDFKKQDGFKKSRDFAKQNDIYCQNYCGCEFSAKKS